MPSPSTALLLHTQCTGTPRAQGTGIWAKPAVCRRTSEHTVIIGSPGTKNPFHREAIWASKAPSLFFRKPLSKAQTTLYAHCFVGYMTCCPQQEKSQTQHKDPLLRPGRRSQPRSMSRPRAPAAQPPGTARGSGSPRPPNLTQTSTKTTAHQLPLHTCSAGAASNTINSDQLQVAGRK